MRENVLLTSAGRRTSLVSVFKRIANAGGGKLVCGDTAALAPTLYLADIPLRLPEFRSDNFLDALLNAIDEHAVRLLVPTRDIGMAAMAAAAPTIREHGCTPVFSSPRMIDACADKWKTFQEFGSRGIPVAQSRLPGDDLSDLPSNLFVKPRVGWGGIHAYQASQSTVAGVLELVPNPIIQELLEGPEVSIDALLDLNGRPIHYVPRERIRAVGGESIEGVTLDDSELGPWILKVLEACADLGAAGPLTLQCFLTPRGPVLTEINPRFGGGFPLCYAAGGLYPEWLWDMAHNVPVKPRLGEYKRGLYMTRHYTEIFLEEPFWSV